MDLLKMFEVEFRMEEAMLGAENDEYEFLELAEPKSSANKESS